MKTYSNPRMDVTVSDWPYGQFRTTARFYIERTTRGERVIRVTIDPKTGRLSAPKKLTYAYRMRIVDGSDMKTYIIEDNVSHITVMRGDMKFQEENIFSGNERYPAMLALFEEKEQTGEETMEASRHYRERNACFAEYREET